MKRPSLFSRGAISPLSLSFFLGRNPSSKLQLQVSFHCTRSCHGGTKCPLFFAGDSNVIWIPASISTWVFTCFGLCPLFDEEDGGPLGDNGDWEMGNIVFESGLRIKLLFPTYCIREIDDISLKGSLEWEKGRSFSICAKSCSIAERNFS